MTEIIVRPATDADAPALVELLNAIIARGGTTGLEQAFTPERLAHKYLTGPNVFSCFVAHDSETGEALGFQTLTREAYVPENWGDIGTFARVGGTQRGVGSTLFAATRERAAELGLAGLNAQIRADNHGGLAFYTRMGFQDHHVDAAVPLSDGRPVDRITKRFPLQAELPADSGERIFISTP
jgi:L-amino acid N-acyltransferase YncA